MRLEKPGNQFLLGIRSGNLGKTMKSEAKFEYRSETYWQVRRARNGKFGKEFAFSQGSPVGQYFTPAHPY